MAGYLFANDWYTVMVKLLELLVTADNLLWHMCIVSDIQVDYRISSWNRQMVLYRKYYTVAIQINVCMMN